MNPFDVHARDFDKFLNINTSQTILFSCLWVIQRIVDFSDIDGQELADRGFSTLIPFYEQTIYNVKIELAGLILMIMTKLGEQQMVQLFTDNLELFASFLELEDDETIKCTLQIIWNVLNIMEEREELFKNLRETVIGEILDGLESDEYSLLIAGIQEMMSPNEL
jgi:hypothetical protein